MFRYTTSDRRRRAGGLIFILLFWCVACSLIALDYYVSAGTGAPGNPGTAAAPFDSLSTAREALRTFTASGMSEDITVFFAGGFYDHDTPVVFDTADSGKDGYTINYRNSPGEVPVLSAARRVSGWAFYSGPVYRASVGSGVFPTLYENNKPGVACGSLADLTEPGTFHLSGGYLYYYPRRSPVASQEILLPGISRLIELAGYSDTWPVSNLAFEGLTFSATARDEGYSGAPGDQQALFTVRNAANIKLRHCRLLNAGNAALLIDKYAQNITVDHNRIDGFGGHGISLSGLVPGDADFDDPVLSFVNRDNLLTNNLITSGGSGQTGSAGIHLYQSGTNRIEANYLTRIDGSGVMLTGTGVPANTRNNLVEANRIYRIYADSPDSAGIYLAAPGSSNTIRKNLIYELRNYVPANRIAGIFLDDGARNSLVTGNAVYKVHDIPGTATGLKIAGRDLQVVNNLFADNDPFYDVVYRNDGENGSGVTLEHNIFYTPAGNYYHYFASPGLPDAFGAGNNLVYHPGGDYNVYLPTSYRISFDQWYASSWQDRGTLIDIDPRFLEPAAGLYKLPPASGLLSSLFTNLDFQTPGLPGSFVYRYADDRIEAEKYNYLQGPDNREALVQLAGSYNLLRYESIRFESHIHYLNLRYAADTAEGVSTNVSLEVRRDSAVGLLLGSAPIMGTGGLDEFDLLSLPVSVAPGVCDLYFVFQGSNAQNIQLDWFEFSETAELEPQLPDQPPYLEVLSPADNAQLTTGSAVDIEAIASDPDGYIDRIELYINGVLEMTSNNASLVYTWSAPPAGDYTLLLRAVDSQGLDTDRTLAVSVRAPSAQVPVVTIQEPADGQVFSGPVNINVVATVSGEDINVVEFFFNGLLLYYDREAPYTYLWQNVQPGEYRIEVKATNVHGYYSSRIVNIVVDNSRFIIGHWPLDEFHGVVANDISGNNYHGSVVNVFTVNGVNAGAFDFPGNAGVITGKPVLNNLMQFTMAGWIYPRAFGYRSGFWGQDGVVEFGFNGENVVHLWTQNGGGANVLYPYPLEEWHHIAVMGDGQSLKVYLDGTLRAREPRSTNNYGASYGSFNIGGGGIFDAGGNFFNGLIDDVIVYNRAITDYEIRLLARKESNIQPSVRIVSPANGSRLDGPTNVYINVAAEDTDSGVRLVEYFANGELIGSNDQAPYSFEWVGVVPQVYTLTARITDNDNASTSDTITFSVVLPDDTLIAYWSFDERSESLAYDLSPNQNHGEITNGTPVDGIYNGALEFGGSGAVVSRRGLLNNLSAFTLAGWIKPVKTGQRIGLWGQDGVVEFGFNGSNLVHLWVANAGHIDVEYPFPMEEWHHVAAVGDGHAVRVYYDGIAAAILISEVYSYGSTDWTFNIAGGGIFDTTGNYFTGVVDEVYAYREALSAEKLTALANANAYQLPEIRITSPAENAVLTFPFSQEITAEVARVECGVTAVEFFIDGRSVRLSEGQAEVEVYRYTWVVAGEPEGEEVTLKVKLTTPCGLWDEAAIKVRLQSGADGGEEEPEDPLAGEEESGELTDAGADGGEEADSRATLELDFSNGAGRGGNPGATGGDYTFSSGFTGNNASRGGSFSGSTVTGGSRSAGEAGGGVPAGDNAAADDQARNGNNSLPDLPPPSPGGMVGESTPAPGRGMTTGATPGPGAGAVSGFDPGSGSGGPAGPDARNPGNEGALSRETESKKPFPWRVILGLLLLGAGIPVGLNLVKKRLAG